MSRGLDHYARRVLSGQERGARASFVRAATSVISPLYATAMRLRNVMFDGGWTVRRLARPVISVGNLTTGGTGKTPVVHWLHDRLKEAGHRPAVLMRGYKAVAGKDSDEQAMLRDMLGAGAIVRADSSRYAGGLAVLRDHPEATTFILDDGFQHRRLAREFDLVLIDAVNPFGYGRVLPRGLLREPLAGLRRADAILLTRVDLAPAEELERIVARVRRYNTAAPIYQCSAVHAGLRDARGQRRGPEFLTGQPLFAFAGIGNPEAFERQLRSSAGQLVGSRWLADHHAYSRADLDGLLADARGAGADVAVTTEKDWVKVGPLLRETDTPVVMRIEVALRFTGEDDRRLFEQIVSRVKSYPP